MILDIEENILKSDEDAIRLQVLQYNQIPLSSLIIDGDKYIIEYDNISSPIYINSEQSRDFFLSHCKEIRSDEVVEIRTSVDIDFSTFPKLSYNLLRARHLTVRIEVQAEGKINLTNLTSKSFGLTANDDATLAITGYCCRPELSLKDLYWDGHSVMLARVKLHDVNRGCFGEKTYLCPVSEVEPGDRLDTYVNQQLLCFYLHKDDSTKSTGIRVVDESTPNTAGKGVAELVYPGYYVYYGNAPLSDFGVNRIKATKDNTIHVPPKVAEHVDGAAIVYISGYGRINVDNSKNDVKNKAYVICTDFLLNARAGDLNLVCDTENDRDITHTFEYKECSYLRINKNINNIDWYNIKCNCNGIFINCEDPLVQQLASLGRWKNAKDSDMDKVIPLDNFPNLKYIIWSSIAGLVGIHRRKDGCWYWFNEE
jgi:hypothetical protein